MGGLLDDGETHVLGLVVNHDGLKLGNQCAFEYAGKHYRATSFIPHLNDASSM